MKFPSIIKIPSYQRFNYEPRYYDPIKEDIEERRQKYRKQMDAEGRRRSSRSRIEGSFRRRANVNDNSGFLRLGVGALLFGGIVGFLYFGNIAVYITGAVAFIYLVLKKFVFR
ncbi:MAG: hypothetical protein R3356_03285 [Eudoraea sp.]|nr:hypothetical protein [Eudoraea sp.]